MLLPFFAKSRNSNPGKYDQIRDPRRRNCENSNSTLWILRVASLIFFFSLLHNVVPLCLLIKTWPLAFSLLITLLILDSLTRQHFVSIPLSSHPMFVSIQSGNGTLDWDQSGLPGVRACATWRAEIGSRLMSTSNSFFFPLKYKKLEHPRP